MDAQEVMHMTDYSKITALYSRLSVGDEDRDGGESNSIQNQKIFLENYARGQDVYKRQELSNTESYLIVSGNDEIGSDVQAYAELIRDNICLLYTSPGMVADSFAWIGISQRSCHIRTAK